MPVDREDVARVLPTRYHLVGRLGGGGFGDVFRAFDRQLERHVAVKALAMADADLRHRAYGEARVLARLNHPHLVSIFDVVEADALFLLVMEFVPGGALSGLPRPVVLGKVCALGLAAADALAYVHGQKLLHRDLKPANLMIAEDGTAKVVDFGIAKMFEHSAVVGRTGTPTWMAPEQRSFQPLGPGTDLYSLALVLYWLLGGLLPPEPQPPLAGVHPAVMRVVARALEAGIGARHPSAHAFAVDLAEAAGQALGGGWLRGSGLRVLLVDDDIREAAQASVRRLGVNVPPGGFAGHDLRGADLSGLDLANANLGGADLTGARLAHTILTGARLRKATLAGTKLDHTTLVAADLTGADFTGARLAHTDLTGAVLTGSRWQGAALLSCTVDPAVLVCAELAGAAVPGRDPHAIVVPSAMLAVRDAAFSPDGARIVSVGYDSVVRVWDADSGRQLRELTGHIGEVLAVKFSPDGSQIVSGGVDEVVRVWDVATGRPVHKLTGHTGWVRVVGFSPDGARIVSGGEDQTVRVWDAATGRQLGAFTAHSNIVWSVGFSPDGSRIVSGGDDGVVRVWDTVSGRHLRELTGHTRNVYAVGFSPDGALIVSGGDDGVVRVWDSASGRQVRGLTGHANAVLSVAFSPDGARLASGGKDGVVRLWDAATGDLVAALVAVEEEGWGVIVPDGSYKLAGDLAGSLWWMIKDVRFEIGELDAHLPSIKRLPDDAPLPSPSL